jgi:subtilisin family serine protease
MTIFQALVSSGEIDFHIQRKINAESIEDILSSTRPDETIKRIWTNQVFTVPYAPIGAANASEEEENWGIDALQVDKFWNLNIRGQGIKVGIADSGIDPTHPAFSECNIEKFAEFDLNDGKIVRTDAFDSGFHGTHCAAILAGNSGDKIKRGVAPNVSLYVAKVLEEWDGSIVSVSEGLNWLRQQGCDIVSLSFGRPGSYDVWATEISDLIANNCLVVAASGNEYNETYPTRSPANYGLDGLLSVGAHSEKLKIWPASGGGEVKWKSDTVLGDRLVQVPTISAPGQSIVSAAPNNKYRRESGTSMAAPHVAGMAALVLQLLRGRNIPSSPSILSNLITTSVEDLGEVGRDYRYGYGALNGGALLENALKLAGQ